MLSKHFSVRQAIEWVDSTVYTLVLLSHAVRDLVGVCAEHVCIFLCRFCAPHSKDPITVAFVSSLADVDWWQYFIYVWCCAFCLHSHPTYLLTKTVLWGQRCLLSAGRPGPRCWRLPFSSGKWEVGWGALATPILRVYRLHIDSMCNTWEDLKNCEVLCQCPSLLFSQLTLEFELWVKSLYLQEYFPVVLPQLGLLEYWAHIVVLEVVYTVLVCLFLLSWLFQGRLKAA